MPDRTPSEDEVNQAPQNNRWLLSEEKERDNREATATYRNSAGMFWAPRTHWTPDRQYSTEALREALFECIELNWIELNCNVYKQNLFSQMQSNLFTPTWMQPICCCSNETGEPTASLPRFRKVLSELNRLFEILHPWLHAHYKTSRTNSLHSVRVKMFWLLFGLNCVLFFADDRSANEKKSFFLRLTFTIF